MARRPGRCRALRHGGQCDRPQEDRSACASSVSSNSPPISPREILAPGGTFLAKVLQGGTETNLLATLKRQFAEVKHVKPKASRADSSELYVLAMGFRGRARLALGLFRFSRVVSSGPVRFLLPRSGEIDARHSRAGCRTPAPNLPRSKRYRERPSGNPPL